MTTPFDRPLNGYRFVQTQQRLQLVLRGANDAGWDWDVASNELYYSQRWWQMLGHDQNASSSSSPELWRKLVHPEDLDRVETFFESAIKSDVETYEVEFRLRHEQGHYVPVLSRGYISRNDCGQAVRVSGTNTDLTERKAAEEKIHKLAFYDPLTNLPNRRLLTELLRKALNSSARNKQIGALLFIDLDNFKILNDAAARLSSLARKPRTRPTAHCRNVNAPESASGTGTS